MATRSVDVAFRPLMQWPAGRARTPEPEREAAKFTAPGHYVDSNMPTQRYVGRRPMQIERTYDDLNRELSAIDARDAVVQVDFAENSLRRDGSGPRDDRRPYTPAVVLSFRRNGSLLYSFACDRFTRWQDNLRGIVLGLEGLRRLERYGIVQSGEQYRGWQALPEPDGADDGHGRRSARRSEFHSTASGVYRWRCWHCTRCDPLGRLQDAPRPQRRVPHGVRSHRRSAEGAQLTPWSESLMPDPVVGAIERVAKTWR